MKSFAASHEPGFQGALELTSDGVAAFRAEFLDEPYEPLSITNEKLERFLQRTATSALPRSERLRILAAFLETEELRDSWAGLQRIYESAARENPRDPAIYHSWGVSAYRRCDYYEGDLGDEDAEGTAKIAESAYRRALALDPALADCEHGLGLLYYSHHLTDDDEEELHDRALRHFRRAVELDSGCVMAQLYIAHCLHDREEWVPAIEAYLAVDGERLKEEWPRWREVKMREQIAQCCMRAGRLAEAVTRFRKFLDEIESYDDEQFEEGVIDLRQLMDAAENHLDDSELLRRARIAEGHLQDLERKREGEDERMLREAGNSS
jgi:tetratricopeptide (TPR) repeat protein